MLISLISVDAVLSLRASLVKCATRPQRHFGESAKVVFPSIKSFFFFFLVKREMKERRGGGDETVRTRGETKGENRR